MKELTSITWNEAIQQQKEQKKEDEVINKEYEEQLTQAHEFLLENLETDPDRPMTYFDDACSMYGVESDDLLKLII